MFQVFFPQKMGFELVAKALTRLSTASEGGGGGGMTMKNEDLQHRALHLMIDWGMIKHLASHETGAAQSCSLCLLACATRRRLKISQSITVFSSLLYMGEKKTVVQPTEQSVSRQLNVRNVILVQPNTKQTLNPTSDKAFAGVANLSQTGWTKKHTKKYVF